MGIYIYIYKSLCQPVKARIADLDTSKKADGHTGELLLSGCMDLQRIAVKSAPGFFLTCKPRWKIELRGVGSQDLRNFVKKNQNRIFVTDSLYIIASAPVLELQSKI